MPTSLGNSALAGLLFGYRDVLDNGSDPLQRFSTLNFVGFTITENEAEERLDIESPAVSAVPTSRQVIAGAGLTGGGDLSANRTFNVIAADGSIVVNADDIQVGVISDVQHGELGGGGLHADADDEAAGFMPSAHWILVDAATASPTADTLALRDGSGAGAFVGLDLTGSVTFGAAMGAVSIGQTQHASAAGSAMSMRGQQGAPGFVGGVATFGGGDGGTPGTNKAGALNIELGQADGSGETASCQFMSNGTAFGDVRGFGYLRIRNFAGGVANNGIDIAAAGIFNCQASGLLQFESSGNGIRFSASNRSVQWLGAGSLARTDTVHATGATTYVHAAGTTSIAESQAAHASGAGGDWTRTAQAAGGAGNSPGGTLRFRGGARTGTGLRGGVTLGLNGAAETLVQVAEVAADQRVVALLRNADITTTEIPANGGDLVMYVGNCATPPAESFAPVGGSLMWVESGATKIRGTSGTTTTVAAAEPHCPVCGADFTTEHESPIHGYLAICLVCLADELGDRPWIRRRKVA